MTCKSRERPGIQTENKEEGKVKWRCGESRCGGSTATSAQLEKWKPSLMDFQKTYLPQGLHGVLYESGRGNLNSLYLLARHFSLNIVICGPWEAPLGYKGG